MGVVCMWSVHACDHVSGVILYYAGSCMLANNATVSHTMISSTL